ncbi:hypothetical protein Tco_0768142 [Tanacetum coccineum]
MQPPPPPPALLPALPPPPTPASAPPTMPNTILAAADRAIFLPKMLVMEMKDYEGCGFDRWLSNGGAVAENINGT